MVRRSLFFGLTLLLIVVITGLMIRGCRQEKEPTPQVVEKIEESVPSATRVFNAQDLEIVLSTMELDREGNETKPSYTARHEIEIRNHGNVPYKEIGLRFVYRSGGGKRLKARTHSVVAPILPDAKLKLSNIRMEGFSEPVTDPKITIVYADIGTAVPPKK